MFLRVSTRRTGRMVGIEKCILFLVQDKVKTLLPVKIKFSILANQRKMLGYGMGDNYMVGRVLIHHQTRDSCLMRNGCRCMCLSDTSWPHVHIILFARCSTLCPVRGFYPLLNQILPNLYGEALPYFCWHIIISYY